MIRFLPAIEGEDMPWQRVWHHAFQGPGGQWYIENSLTTLNKKVLLVKKTLDCGIQA